MNEIETLTPKQTNRSAGLDILRIISMLMVVTLHYLNENMGGVLTLARGGGITLLGL